MITFILLTEVLYQKEHVQINFFLSLSFDEAILVVSGLRHNQTNNLFGEYMVSENFLWRDILPSISCKFMNLANSICQVICPFNIRKSFSSAHSETRKLLNHKSLSRNPKEPALKFNHHNTNECKYNTNYFHY